MALAWVDGADERTRTADLRAAGAAWLGLGYAGRFAAQAEGVDGADERTRTADLLITSELLYQLSYVGLVGLRAPFKLPPGRRQLSPDGCGSARRRVSDLGGMEPSPGSRRPIGALDRARQRVLGLAIRRNAANPLWE